MSDTERDIIMINLTNFRTIHKLTIVIIISDIYLTIFNYKIRWACYVFISILWLIPLTWFDDILIIVFIVMFFVHIIIPISYIGGSDDDF